MPDQWTREESWTRVDTPETTPSVPKETFTLLSAPAFPEKRRMFDLGPESPRLQRMADALQTGLAQTAQSVGSTLEGLGVVPAVRDFGQMVREGEEKYILPSRPVEQVDWKSPTDIVA